MKPQRASCHTTHGAARMWTRGYFPSVRKISIPKEPFLRSSLSGVMATPNSKMNKTATLLSRRVLCRLSCFRCGVLGDTCCDQNAFLGLHYLGILGPPMRAETSVNFRLHGFPGEVVCRSAILAGLLAQPCLSDGGHLLLC